MATFNVTDTVTVTDIAGRPDDILFIQESVTLSIGTPLLVSDTTTVTDTVAVKPVLNFNVSDSSAVSESIWTIRDRMDGVWRNDSNSVSGHVGGNTVTLPHTIVETGAYLFVSVVLNNGSSSGISGVTYGGVPMTSLTGFGTFNRSATVYGIANQKQGTQNIVVTLTGTPIWTSVIGNAYFGAAIVSPVNATNAVGGNTGSTSLTTPVTTTVDGCMLYGLAGDEGGALTASTNTQARTTDTGNEGATFENTGLARETPVGSYSLRVTFGAGNSNALAVVALAPYPLSFTNVSVTDTVIVTDTPLISKALDIVGSDSTAVFDIPTLLIKDPTYQDSATASLVTSGYKWLTQSLYTAQQGQSLRPTFTAQIVDDLLLSNQQFTGTGTPTGNGNMATAPNGDVYSIGNTGGVLTLKWDSNLNAVNGIWRNSQVLSTAGDGLDYTGNVYSIQISDYYRGTFYIDIAYFGNLTANDGSQIKIYRQYSADGGSTWTKSSITLSNMPNTLTTGLISVNLPLSVIKPRIDTDGNIRLGYFYGQCTGLTLGTAPVYKVYDISYNYYKPATATTLTGTWLANANTKDWTIHSLGAYTYDKIDYCVISGFRSIVDSAGGNSNYSIWTVPVLTVAQSGVNSLWGVPYQVTAIGSTSATNYNTFIYPFAINVKGTVYITFNVTVTDSVSQTVTGLTAQQVTTHTNTQYVISDNGKNFSYPTLIIGTDFSDLNTASYASIVPQNNYMYIGGNGTLWELIKNNIVADITNDVIGYSIQENAGQPSSISLQLGNANNKWVGPATTGAGASAIKRNRKIVIWKGYYNASGVAEYVPRNIYYIDDIQQTVTSARSDLTLSGRDFYKKLKTTTSRYSYQYNGPTYFNDIFDGTYRNQWTTVSGTWNYMPANVFIGQYTSYIVCNDQSATESRMILNGNNQNSYGALTSIFFRGYSSVYSQSMHSYFYPMYFDANNWVRFRLDVTNTGGDALPIVGWFVEKCIAGVVTNVNNGIFSGGLSLPNKGFDYVQMSIRRSEYYKLQFIIPSFRSLGGTANQIYVNDSTFPSALICTFDFASIVQANTAWQQPFTVGFGVDNQILPTYNITWSYFSHYTYNNQNNIGTIIRTLARLAGVFSFEDTYSSRELLGGYNLTGVYSLVNRNAVITAGNQAMSTTNFSNGEMSFKAKMTLTNSASNGGFSFIFRRGNGAGGLDDYYKFHFMQEGTGASDAPTFARFERYTQVDGKIFVFYNSSWDVSYGKDDSSNLRFDATAWHTYRIVMIDGTMQAFIDEIMVATWNDNNSTYNFLTTGKWGFEADANTTVKVGTIIAPNFWKPVQAFTFNAGDDVESAIGSLLQSLRAWVFSDMFGRFKAIFLNSTDPTTYTYDAQLSQQNVDSSDKEYVSSVTVYGSNVSATARNNQTVTGAIARDIVVVDYTIVTQQDAQTRANNELTNANQFQNQYSPRQFINLGAEIFDVVTINNTGNNTSGVSGTTRVYSQAFKNGGGTNSSDYSIELNTGNL